MRSALSALCEALEMACGWALLSAGLYALLFIDVMGDGSVWSALRGLSAHAQAPVESPRAVRRLTVAARASAGRTQEDRFLLALEPKRESDISVAVPADITRPEAAFTDAPAEPRAGASWTENPQGRSRSFTVYGRGEEAAAPTAIIAAPGSAAEAGSTAAARPGVGSRMRAAVAAQSDSVR